MKNPSARRPLRQRAIRVVTSFQCKVATLVVTSAVSFVGSIVALRREDFWPWVVALLIMLLLEMLYMAALGVDARRKAAKLRHLMHRANATRQAQKAILSSLEASSLTD